MNTQELHWMQQNTAYCSKQSAYLQREQCKINKYRAKKLHVYDDTANISFLRVCLSCPGVFNDLPVEEDENDYMHKRRCSSCRAWKNKDQFRLVSGGQRKRVCMRCDEKNKEYKEKVKTTEQDPPMLVCYDSTQSRINSSAVVNFDLWNVPYFGVYEHNGEYFIEGSTEKKEGFFTYTKDGTCVNYIKSSARAILKVLGTNGSKIKFLMKPTNDPWIFKLEEAEDQR